MLAGNIYGKFMLLIAIGTPLSQELVYRFEERREEIMNNEAMLNALFLDPRHLFKLTDNDRKITKKKLIGI